MTTKAIISSMEKEFNAEARLATPEDYRTWAHGPMLKRVHDGDRTMELNADNKVYILNRTKASSLQLEAVVEKPSPQLLARMEAV